MAHRLPVADIQFISDFAAFARSKGDEGYDFLDCGNCACAQFLRVTGRAPAPYCDGFGYWPFGEDTEPYVPISNELGDALAGANTFSALADRLEALIADAPVVERVS